jgi:sec-independent protein translocase protein TatA
MGIFSEWHWIVLLFIVLLVFGPSKLPQLARSIGKSVRELKEGLKDMTTDAPSPPPAAKNEWQNKTAPPESEAQPVQRDENHSSKPV